MHGKKLKIFTISVRCRANPDAFFQKNKAIFFVFLFINFSTSLSPFANAEVKNSATLASFSWKSAATVWNDCLEIIRQGIDDQNFNTWFKPITPLRTEGDVLTIQVPSQFFYEWLEEHYVPVLKKAILETRSQGSPGIFRYGRQRKSPQPALSGQLSEWQRP